jgi:hypothetical protein
MVEIVARGCTDVVLSHTLNNIRSILKHYVPRNREFHLRNLVALNLVLLYLLRSFDPSLLNLHRLGSTHTCPTFKLIEKAPKSTELIDTILKVRSEHRDVGLALVALDLLIDKMTGFKEVFLLFFIFHTLIMARLEGSYKLFIE